MDTDYINAKKEIDSMVEDWGKEDRFTGMECGEGVVTENNPVLLM